MLFRSEFYGHSSDFHYVYSLRSQNTQNLRAKHKEGYETTSVAEPEPPLFQGAGAAFRRAAPAPNFYYFCPVFLLFLVKIFAFSHYIKLYETKS